jgi:hypothetical protein
LGYGTPATRILQCTVSVYICIYIYHPGVDRIRIFPKVSINMDIFLSFDILVYFRMIIHPSIHACMNTYQIYIYIYTHIYIHTYIYVYICIYIHWYHEIYRRYHILYDSIYSLYNIMSSTYIYMYIYIYTYNILIFTLVPALWITKTPRSSPRNDALRNGADRAAGVGTSVVATNLWISQDFKMVKNIFIWFYKVLWIWLSFPILHLLWFIWISNIFFMENHAFFFFDGILWEYWKKNGKLLSSLGIFSGNIM